MNILELAKRNQQKAWEIIEDTRIVRIWEGIGAKVNLVGSLRTGLLMKHRDIHSSSASDSGYRPLPPGQEPA